MAQTSTSLAPHPNTPWTPEDYAPLVTSSGAAKLAASGVAPLVAAARGYETLEEPAVADFASKLGLGNRNAKRHSQVLTATRRGEVMVIHWYRADQVAEARADGRYPVSSAQQMRPSSPRENPANGKLVKYENIAGSESVIDTNPATPTDWFQSSPRLLITEGVLKGDAALTALLRANGIDDADLALTPGTTRVSAIDALGLLMDSIPPAQRVTILSFVGVGNWKGNDVWVSLKLRGRELLLAFDGDIDSNWNVWSQANSLWDFAKGKGAILKLVDLDVTIHEDVDAELNDMANGHPSPRNAGDSKEKVGLDDFVARFGTWKDVLTRLNSELPDAPDRKRDDVIGAVRVAEGGNSVQQYVAGGVDAFGQPTPPKWELLTNIGGRIAAVETHRAPTQVEVRTAAFGAGIDEEDIPIRSSCRIELRWLKADDTQDFAVVIGPAEILMYPPGDWAKHRAEIPNNLLLHPEWPPRKGLDWLSAIKDNNEQPTQQHVSWTTMGWVPVENSSVCSFISGRTIIAPTAEEAKNTVAGVNEAMLPSSSKFSLPVTPNVMSPEWVAQVRSDLDSLFEHYFVDEPWTNKNVAGVVLAAGLRPSVPIRCTSVIYIQGPPGQGKSWTVAQILAFHQDGETWNNKMLPGSMKDTMTAVEQAVAQTNIWVMDDLAPSPDARQSLIEQAKVGDLIRAVHNSSPKRRSGTDLKAREVFNPHALLIITAENEHIINSVRDRTVILSLDKDSLSNGVTKMDEFRDKSGVPGRLLSASVQALQHFAGRYGWSELIELLDDQRKAYAEIAKEIITRVPVAGKSETRHVGMAVDLMIGLAPLQLLADTVGHTDMLSMFDPEREGNIPGRVAESLAVSFISQGAATPGRSVLEAVRNLLAAGHAHILNASDPGSAPLSGDRMGSNRALGWQLDATGQSRPMGVAIGHLSASRRGGDLDIVYLHKTNAFDVAARKYPAALPPGTSAATSFGSVWNEKLIHPKWLQKGRDGTRVDIRYAIDGHAVRGVPIHIDTIVGEVLPNTDDDLAGAADGE